MFYPFGLTNNSDLLGLQVIFLGGPFLLCGGVFLPRLLKQIQGIDGEKQPSLASWAKGRLRWARYGLVSMKRDEVYAHGQGDLMESLKLVKEQLEIYPDFPSRYHDLATIRVMLFNFLEKEENLTVESFQKAQESAFKAWKAGLKERGRSKECHNAGIFYDWSQALGTGGSLVSLKQVVSAQPCGLSSCDHRAYVATFKDVGLSGDDGIIVNEDECQIFMASAGLAVDLAKNLQLLEIWGDPPTPHASGPSFKWFDISHGRAPNHGAWEKPMQVKKAASLLQFAATSHFHIMTELFARLWLLKDSGLLDDPETRLILPKPKAGSFLSAGLKILTGGSFASERLIHWTTPGPNDVLLRADPWSLGVGSWLQKVVFFDVDRLKWRLLCSIV